MFVIYLFALFLTVPSVWSSPVSSSYSNPPECGITNATIYNPLIGGGETEPGEWPWMAYVKTNSSYCGGVLISNIHILTAAHCVGSDLKRMEIRLGEFNIYDNEQAFKRKVVKAAIHEGFKAYWDLPDVPSTNDIAVLTLDEPVPFSKDVSPICLPEGKRSYSGVTGTVIGYGAMGPDGPDSEILRIISAPIWNNKACQVRQDRGPIFYSHICFGEPGKGACHGDSGGPLMVYEKGRWFTVGVTGWVREACNVDLCGQELCDSNGCGETVCDTAYPTVYARITEFMPWILDKMKQ